MTAASPLHAEELRRQALSRLTGGHGADSRTSAAAALGVLHDLASSPSTAADALALLHELQVHQVELDLQAEELRNSRLEMEASLARQVELYEDAPTGCLSVSADTTVQGLNRTAARLIGLDREAVIGRPLGDFVGPRGDDALRTLLARVAQGHRDESCRMLLAQGRGGARSVLASAGPDPQGGGFFVALTPFGADDANAGAGPRVPGARDGA